MPEPKRVIRGVALGVVLASMGACSTAQHRPVLETSAVEASAASGADSDLDFFDTLESARLVCHDDVLNAALLLGNGESGPTYADRVMLARRLGYVESGFDRPAREAATLGEVAKVFVRVSDGAATGDRLSQEQAMTRMAARGLMPADAKPYQGMTGAQLLTVMSGVRTAMGERERPHVRLAAAAEAAPATPPAAATPSPMESPGVATTTGDASTVASADGSLGAKAEPLPPAATDVSIEREAAHTPPAPAATPAPPPAAPAATPTKPREWIQGSPLRKSGK